MFTPELQRSVRTSSQKTAGEGRSCLTPLSSSTPRRKSVGHVPLSTSWGSSPNTRNALQEVNKQRTGSSSGSFSLPRRASLSNNLEKSILSRSRSMQRIPSTDEDSVFNNKEAIFPKFRNSLGGSVQNLGSMQRIPSTDEDSVFSNKEAIFPKFCNSLGGSVQNLGSMQSLNKFESSQMSQMFMFDESTQETKNSIVRSSNKVEFEQTLFERTALRHARRLRLQDEANEMCQETALLLEKTAKLMANTARVRRLRIQLDIDLLDVETLCVGRKYSRDFDDILDDTIAVYDDRIYQEIDPVTQNQPSKRYYDEEKENRGTSSPYSKRRSTTPVQTNRAAKLRNNSIRRQRDGSTRNLHEKPPAIPRNRKQESKKSKSELNNTSLSLTHSMPQGRMSLKEKHLDQEQQDKDQIEKATIEKAIKQGFQMKLKKVSKKLTSSRLGLDKKVDVSVESTWL